MHTPRRTPVVALSLVALGVLVAGAATGAPAQPGSEAGRSAHQPVEISATPSRLEIVGLPCLPGSLDVGMTNTGDDDLYADTTLDATTPVELDRHVFSSWLPADDPDVTVTAEVNVTTPRDTEPGRYSINLAAGRSRLTVPVRVLPLPPKGPGDNLALGESSTASSTHGTFPGTCGAVDGVTDSDLWPSRETGWNDGTSRRFPDTYQVTLGEPADVGEVKLYTLDSERYPASAYGLRDWDVELLVDGTWHMVDEVRGNVDGVATSTFEPQLAEAVRIVAHDANDHAYSRIIELEVYSSP
ncbi:galactose-binding domain-containing protein [Phytoactinopolyspora halotolerans]|uniref:F5/8 type C domain-containing protein n=1 Tax=Phytoactinopolyspora halotolerans TaxID=1981512 RepID=A0A6L9SEW4_9ACTN|nr:hypothetical protein [Phytoactinopolyspora halotolerans]NEE03128.1 hypothetical protein [Phytoactinopolyspora halotolerans]